MSYRYYLQCVLAVCCFSVWLLSPGVLADQSPVVEQSCRAPELSPAPMNADYEPFAGKTIASIRFNGIEVFDPNDPDENNALYQFLNKLHINTRPSVLRAQLLFDVGDALNPSEVAESERILRALPYLSYAIIRVDQVCGDEVALMVQSRDIWTTEPIFNLSHEGGETESGIGFQEGNLLGRGSELMLRYDKDAERSGMQYNFYSPHLFKTRLRLHVGYAQNSDGEETVLQVYQPFYSLNTRWAGGISNEQLTQREKIDFNDITLNTYRHDIVERAWHLGYALAANDARAHRVTVGLRQEKDNYRAVDDTQYAPPEDTNFIYPMLGYAYIQNKFGVYENLDLIHRIEDVALGIQYRMSLGYGGATFGNDADVVRVTTDYSDVVGLGEHHILKWAVDLDATWSPNYSNYNERLWNTSLRYYFLHGSNKRYFASLRYSHGENLLPHEELTSGGEYGLRGYPLDYQRGDERYVLTAESRYITDLHIFNLFRIGTVAFVDVGKTWGAGYGGASLLAGAGVGIRLSSSKAKLDHIAHLDLAFPLVDKDQVDEYQLVMKVEKHF